MSSDLIKYTKVSFLCPLCRKRQTYTLMYIPRKQLRIKKKPSYSTACRCKKCDRTTLLTYQVHQTKKGLLKLKVISCLANENWYKNRRYCLTKVPEGT